MNPKLCSSQEAGGDELREPERELAELAYWGGSLSRGPTPQLPGQRWPPETLVESR